MANSPTALASELLDRGPGGPEELRVQLFDDLEDDENALDDAFMEKLFKDFSSEFEKAHVALTEEYDKPSLR